MIRRCRSAPGSPGCSAGRTTRSSTPRPSSGSNTTTCRCRPRSACWASTVSPRTTGCSSSAGRSPARRSWSRPPPARSAPASARSPGSTAAARSASPAAPAKRALCVERFGYDAAVDYKAPDFTERLAEACAGGVDVYFDNTAGAISDAVMTHLNVGARVVICGTASVASWEPAAAGAAGRAPPAGQARADAGLRDLRPFPEYYATARAATWRTGCAKARLLYLEDVLDGIEHAPDAIAGLYRGENLGKRLIRIAAE